MAIADQIETLVGQQDGLTDTTLSEHVFGVPDYHQFVAIICDQLIKAGRIERLCAGHANIGCTYARA